MRLISIILSIAIPLSSLGNDLEKCKDRVNKCERLVNLVRGINDGQMESIKELTRINHRLDRENDQLLQQVVAYEKSDGQWYKNPLIIGVLAFSTGVLLHEFAR